MAHDNTLWTTAELRRLGKTARQIAAAVKDGTIRPVIRGVYCTDVASPSTAITRRGRIQPATGPATPTRPHRGHRPPACYGMVEMSPGPARPGHPSPGTTASRQHPAPPACRASAGARAAPQLQPARRPGDHAVPQAGRRPTRDPRTRGVKGNDALAEDLTALPPRHRGAAARLLDGLVTGTASKLELRAVHHLLRALDGVDVTVKINHKVEGYRFDIVIEEADVLVEIDSYAFHGAGGEKMSEETFQTDRWKGNTAVRAGRTLLRYSDSCVNFLGPTVAEQIADTVRYNLPGHRRSQFRRRRLGEFLTSDLPAWLWHPLLRRFV
jgi:very-short-patch-repair endonuclease